MRLLRPVILLLMLGATAHAEVYSWKDATGKIHYGDKPPADRHVDARKLADPPPVDAAAARQSFDARQQATRAIQQKELEEGKRIELEQAQEGQRVENCRRARASLTAIESGQIRYTLDASGERVALDGAVREAEIARARKAVNNWCGPSVAK